MSTAALEPKLQQVKEAIQAVWDPTESTEFPLFCADVRRYAAAHSDNLPSVLEHLDALVRAIRDAPAQVPSEEVPALVNELLLHSVRVLQSGDLGSHAPTAAGTTDSSSTPSELRPLEADNTKLGIALKGLQRQYNRCTPEQHRDINEFCDAARRAAQGIYWRTSGRVVLHQHKALMTRFDDLEYELEAVRSASDSRGWTRERLGEQLDAVLNRWKDDLLAGIHAARHAAADRDKPPAHIAQPQTGFFDLGMNEYSAPPRSVPGPKKLGHHTFDGTSHRTGGVASGPSHRTDRTHPKSVENPFDAGGLTFEAYDPHEPVKKRSYTKRTRADQAEHSLRHSPAADMTPRKSLIYGRAALL